MSKLMAVCALSAMMLVVGCHNGKCCKKSTTMESQPMKMSAGEKDCSACKAK